MESFSGGVVCDNTHEIEIILREHQSHRLNHPFYDLTVFQLLIFDFQHRLIADGLCHHPQIVRVNGCMSRVVIVEQLIADKPFDLCLFLLGHTKVQDDLQLLFQLFSGEGSAFQQNLAQGQHLTFGKPLDLLRDQTIAIFFFVVLDSADDALFGALFCQKIPDAVNITLDGAGIYMVLPCGFLFVDELAGKKGLVKLQHAGGF